MNDMDAIKEVAARPGGKALLARKANISNEAVRKIASGKTTNPRVHNYFALVKAAREALGEAPASEAHAEVTQ